jgi:hypothetical protein
MATDPDTEATEMTTQPTTQWNPTPPPVRPRSVRQSVLFGLVYAAAAVALFAVVGAVCLWFFVEIFFRHATFG